ncbi:MAG: hypothetical protein HQ594_04160 [Candidatus Omnitrophica bacterium]|nr:hypothetical protein [Candidatus Omnitrophota bacterium]
MKELITLILASFFFFLPIIPFANGAAFDEGLEELSQTQIPNVEGDWRKSKRFGNRGWVETNRLIMNDGALLQTKLLEHPLVPPGGVSKIADNFDFEQNAFTRPDSQWGSKDWKLFVKNENLLIEEYYGSDGTFYRFEWRRE